MLVYGSSTACWTVSISFISSNVLSLVTFLCIGALYCDHLFSFDVLTLDGEYHHGFHLQIKKMYSHLSLRVSPFADFF